MRLRRFATREVRSRAETRSRASNSASSRSPARRQRFASSTSIQSGKVFSDSKCFSILRRKATNRRCWGRVASASKDRQTVWPRETAPSPTAIKPVEDLVLVDAELDLDDLAFLNAVRQWHFNAAREMRLPLRPSRIERNDQFSLAILRHVKVGRMLVNASRWERQRSSTL